MRIIKLGNIDLRFSCPKCKTIFEVGTIELEEEDDHWKTQCPLCYEEIKIMPDNSIRDFLIRRKELESLCAKD